MNFIFDFLAAVVIFIAVVVGFEVAHDENRTIQLGICGCFFIVLAGVCISTLDVDNYGWGKLPLVLLIAAVPAAIGIILLYIWKKE